MNVSEKVAIVTGASAGIGAATTKALLNLGMRVVGFARRKERILQLSKNDKFFAVNVDITKDQEILDGFAWVTKNVGPVHVLVNNAGIASSTTIINGDEKHWKSIMDTNFNGVVLASREAIKVMQQHEIDGYIINISSITGRYIVDMSNLGIYAASKFAVNAFAEHLRLDLIRMNSNIRISNILPGAVHTEILEVGGFMTKEQNDEFFKNAKHLKPEDIANTIIYLIKTPPQVQITELIIRPLGEKNNFDL